MVNLKNPKLLDYWTYFFTRSNRLVCVAPRKRDLIDYKGIMTLKELGPNYRSSLGAGHRMT
jgi:hypothetical protein